MNLGDTLTSEKRRSWAALCLAILIWSLSPILVATSRFAAPPPLTALLAVVGAFVGHCLVQWARGNRIRSHIAAVRSSGQLIRTTFVGAGAFFIYPMAFFAALQLGDPIAANIVNYLWPVFAVIFTGIRISGRRSLEGYLAVLFGFSGAFVAFLSRDAALDSSLYFTGSRIQGLSLLFAGIGALVYGAVTAFAPSSSEEDRQARKSIAHFSVTLLSGAVLASVGLLAALLAGSWDPAVLFKSGGSLVSLAIYAALLPLAHMCWLYVAQDDNVPASGAIFLVPVLGTIPLAIWLDQGVAKELFAALALVMCGVVFALARSRRIPARFAIILGMIASLLVGQVLGEKTSSPSTVELEQLAFMTRLLAAFLAVFGGFVLSNAIRRYNWLLEAGGRLYAAIWQAHSSDSARLKSELRATDALLRGTASDAPLPPGRPNTDTVKERVDVDIATSTRVSGYEWMVLAGGSTGVLVAIHALPMSAAIGATSWLRAAATAVIVGILFTVRDYDLNRPEQIERVIQVCRSSIGELPDTPSPTPASRRSEVVAAALAALLGIWALLENL